MIFWSVCSVYSDFDFNKWQVSGEAIQKRHKQGWLKQITNDLDECIQLIRNGRLHHEPTSIGYHGNVVQLW